MSHSVECCSHITSLASDVFNGLLGFEGDMVVAFSSVAEQRIPWDLACILGKLWSQLCKQIKKQYKCYMPW